MSRARHNNKFKSGGAPMIDSGREDEEEKKMEEGHKKGGKVARKNGGSVEFGEGEKSKTYRMDRPGRKRGGGVGADRTPLSSAAKTTDASGHTTGCSGTARQNPSDG